MSLADLAANLRASRGFAHKRDLEAVASLLRTHGAASCRNGDDCAVLPDGEGHLLLAIEGFLNEFIEADPWFAGYCAVMVNASDIYSMGGRPLAVVDALWSPSFEGAAPVLEGMLAAARLYGIPVIGGHTNTRSTHGQLAAAILGRASHLLTSFDARPGQSLIAVIDLRGRYREPHPYWDASTGSQPERLRGDLELLPGIAEAGLCGAAKDISMGGVLGSALMLLECSGVGATIDVDAIVRPAGVPLERWLASFPSYGFVLAVDEEYVTQVLERFADRNLAASVFGRVEPSHIVSLYNSEGEQTTLWCFEETSFIGFYEPSQSRQNVAS